MENVFGVLLILQLIVSIGCLCVFGLILIKVLLNR